jgi:hypothetical protein
MSDPTLHQLEREVEASRAKLAGDLSVLRSPRTYSEFTADLKSEALNTKDALLDQAKSRVQSTIDSLVDEVKARAAANPAAALAIGAGIAWRLIQRPPIATALVGAGLYSLLRTGASRSGPRTNEAYLSQARERLVEQAGDFAEDMKDRAVALGERAAEKTSEIAGSVREHALAMGETVADKATGLAGAAADRAENLSEEVRSSLTRSVGNGANIAGDAVSTLEEVRQSSMRAAERAASRAATTVERWKRPDQEPNGQQDARDQVLLGVAGVAVLAALSIAWQRRSNEPAGVD